MQDLLDDVLLDQVGVRVLGVLRRDEQPLELERALPYVLVLTRAWTSTRIGPDPSTQQRTAEPGVPEARSDRNNLEGLATGRRPLPVISKTPSSLTAPNRFLIARMTRCE